MQRSSQRELPACYPDAVAWLADHVDELQTPPVRLHDRAYGDDGAPRLSAAFLAFLTASPYDAYDVTETRTCPITHPYGVGCHLCGGNLTFDVPRRLYRHPLAAALASLRHAPATSRDWPTPYAMVLTLLREGLDLDRAAASIEHPILGPDHRKTVEAAFLLAVRKLVGRWASGPLPRVRLSDAQADAEAAA